MKGWKVALTIIIVILLLIFLSHFLFVIVGVVIIGDVKKVNREDYYDYPDNHFEVHWNKTRSCDPSCTIPGGEEYWTESDCARACQDNKNCKEFVFNTAFGAIRKCYLKNPPPDAKMVYTPYAYTGIKVPG